MKMNKVIGLAVALVLMSACQGYKLVEHQSVAEFDGVFTMVTDGEWNRYQASGLDLWTLDGPALQSINVRARIEDGETISQAEDAQVYRTSMTMIELIDLVKADLERKGMHNIEVLDSEPVDVDGYDGFLTEMRYQHENGLDGISLVKGFVKDGTLNLAHYAGLTEHYYQRAKPQVDSMLASMDVIEK